MRCRIRFMPLAFLGMLALSLLACQEKKTHEVTIEGPDETVEVEVETTE